MKENVILTREEPNSGEVREYPWNTQTVKKFELDSADIAKLENMDVLFIDGTAYCLEEME